MLTSPRLARLLRGKNQRTAAEELGITPELLSKVERRQLVPSVRVRDLIASYLNVPGDLLFEENGLARPLRLGEPKTRETAQKILDLLKKKER